MLVGLTIILLVLGALALVTLESSIAATRRPFVERGWRAFRKGRRFVYEEFHGGAWKRFPLQVRFVSTGRHSGYMSLVPPLGVSITRTQLLDRLNETFLHETFRIEEEPIQSPQTTPVSAPR